MELQMAQEEVDQLIREFGGYWNKFQILAHLTEELGEVASALQREAGLRPRKADTSLAEEVGDLFFTLTVFANKNELDLEKCLQSTLQKYRSRDG